MTDTQHNQPTISDLPIPLERDVFMRSLVRELANVLENTVGIEQAAGFISVVGQAIGKQINSDYRNALQVPNLNRQQVAAVLADLKQRIQGNFQVVEQSEQKIVLKSNSCPFAEKVVGQKAMCMMTSNVFGHITAENLGYAKVELRETIAEGAPGCHVVIYLTMPDENHSIPGREYFRSSQDD